MATLINDPMNPHIFLVSNPNTTVPFSHGQKLPTEPIFNVINQLPPEAGNSEILNRFFSTLPEHMIGNYVQTLLNIEEKNQILIDETYEIEPTPLITKTTHESNLNLLRNIMKINPNSSENEIDPKEDWCTKRIVLMNGYILVTL